MTLFALARPSALTLLWVAICGACASPSALQTARTLPTDAAQGGLSLGTYRGLDVFTTDDLATQTVHPTFELFARRGMNDWTDCGVRLFSFGGKADCKLQVLRTRLLDVGVAPGLGYTTSFLSAHILDGYLQALIGVNLGAEPFQPGAVSLVGSLTPLGRCFAAEGRPTYGCYGQLAYSGALAIQITSLFGLHAEVAWMRSPWPTPPTVGTAAAPFWQFMLAGVFTVLPPPPR